MEPAHSAEDRLSALERRVAELEAAATSTEPTEAKAAATPKPPGASSAAERAAAAAHSAPALPGATDTRWALPGPVAPRGDGVTYPGYTTPPGGEAPVAWQVGMSGQGLQEIDFAEAAGCLAALGHPVRLQLLQ